MSQREDKDVVEGSRASHGRARSVPSIIQRTDQKKWPTWSLPLMSYVRSFNIIERIEWLTSMPVSVTPCRILFSSSTSAQIRACRRCPTAGGGGTTGGGQSWGFVRQLNPEMKLVVEEVGRNFDAKRLSIV
jgi:hypothetical protein